MLVKRTKWSSNVALLILLVWECELGCLPLQWRACAVLCSLASIQRPTVVCVVDSGFVDRCGGSCAPSSSNTQACDDHTLLVTQLLHQKSWEGIWGWGQGS